MTTARNRIGKLAPRYTFLLNSHPDQPLGKCPQCRRPTHPRKFAFFIHAEGWGPLLLGKTCRYCSRCELIMADQFELEFELRINLERLAPQPVGKEYLVLGTIDRNVWKRGLHGEGSALGDVLDVMADFKKYVTLEVDPGGWRFTGKQL
jgi:hypothetical protein